MAPQTDEFGTKVALLGGLVLVCAVAPAPRPARSRAGIRRRTTSAGSRRGSRRRPGRRRDRAAGRAGRADGRRGASSSASASSSPAPRRAASSSSDRRRARPGAPRGRPVDVPDDHRRAGRRSTGTTRSPAPGAQEIVLTLAENLELENQALLRGDATILEAVDHGDRLDEMRGVSRTQPATGTTVIERYEIDDVNVTLLVPFGRQDGLSLGLESTGTHDDGDLDADGNLQSRTTSPLARRSSCAGRPADAGSTSPNCHTDD